MSTHDLNPFELTGRLRTHVRDLLEPQCTLHPEVIEPLMQMRAAAARQGIDLAPASSFRDFSRQQSIWNAKFRGERAIYDRNGCLIDGSCLAPAARVEAILCWSALPGSSRHHWGTDFDIFDRAALPTGAALQLQPAEYALDGPFAALSAWLDQNMAQFGFYRPYATVRSGVSPEPWHISYAPIALTCAKQLTPEILAEAVMSGEVEGAAEILAVLPALHARFMVDTDAPGFV